MHFLDYLKAPNKDSFYIPPTTPKEISDLIKTSKNSKSLGLNSITTNIFKEFHETISIPLSTLINKSFTTGLFLNMCQIAKIVPIKGSVLGPLLFLLYINDLNKPIKNLRAYYFADDTKIT